MITSRHTIGHCDSCQTDMVFCADCGNNCCNAGTKDVDGKPCGCSEAYEHQDALYADPDSVTFANDRR